MAWGEIYESDYDTVLNFIKYKDLEEELSTKPILSEILEFIRQKDLVSELEGFLCWEQDIDWYWERDFSPYENEQAYLRDIYLRERGYIE